MSSLKDNRWTEDEDRCLRELYPTHSLMQISEVIGRDIRSVRYRSSRLGLKGKSPPWTQSQIEVLVSEYQRAAGLGVNLEALAVAIGKCKTNVCRKARELGLTKQNRRKSRRIPLPMVSARTKEDRAESIRRGVLKYFAENGHPRGMAGKKHKPEVVAKFVEAVRKAWKDPNSKFNSEQLRLRRAERMREMNKSGLFTAENQFSRCKRGYRDDIGIWVRSSWEANYARFLNTLMDGGTITGWEYESRTFEFPVADNLPSSYKPDFKVTFPSGRVEWHEVKGWLTENGRLALERMATEYPNEVVRVIDAAWFKQAKRDDLHRSIPGWE